MTEKKWDAVPNQSILANGGTEGQIVVPDSTLFRVKQKVFLKSDAQQSRELVINGISKTGVLRLGKKGGAITDGEDLSDFLTADNAIIWAERQDRSTITPNDYERAVYDEEPVMAKRVTQVDPMGNKYSTTNPMPVRLSDGSINIGTVNAELEVQLSHKNNDPNSGDVADSVRIGDGVEELEINADKEALVHDQDTHDAITSVNNSLQTIIQHVDGLEGFTDGIEGLLTTIRDNADTVESLLTAIGTNTDGVESLQTATNALLTTIRDNADQLEGYTDGLETLLAASNALLTTIRDNADQVEGYTDGLETLIASTNALLTTIRDNADTVETLIANTNSLVTTSNSLLTAIGSNTDTVETLIANSNSLLTTIRDNADTVESLVTSSNALLTTIRDNADTVETLIANSNTLLTAIGANTDTVEALLTAVGSNTDTVETLIANSNALLTTIRDNADQLEGYTDTLEALISASNTLATTSNTLLTAIGTNTDQLEGYTDGVEGLLTTIRDNADTVETLITASNVLLTALGNNTDQLEGFVDGVETLLTAIRDNADNVETLITSTNTKLDELKTEVDSSNYTMNEAFNKAQAAAGQLDDVATTDATEDNIAPIRITPKRAQHINLRNNNGTEVGTAANPLIAETRLPANYARGVFGGARVVTTQNVFESLFSFDKQPTIWDEVLTTGGTSTFNANTNSIDMAVTTASGSSVVRQTFRRMYYNPSRAVQYITAAVLGAGKANVRKRIGQFDTLDGLFFEQDGLINYVVRRTSVSGAAVDTRVAQADWNIDKFDGTGPSGITIDFSKQQAFYVQYAFQGFADICYGFYLNRQISFCHRETTANVLNQPFMRTAHLPCRVEITNTGTSASVTTFSYNSFTVKNEGEDSDTEGQVRSYSAAPIKTVGITTVPVISVRLGPGFQRAIADILSTNIFVQTVDEVIWSVWLSPTLTGATFAITASYTQLDTAATAMSGGTELISGILSQNSSSASVSQDLLKLVNSLIGVSIGGTSQIITLAARSRAGTADVLSTFVWREYP